MSFLIFVIAFGLAILGLAAAVFLALETLAALLPGKSNAVDAEPGPAAIVIPAHNEATTIGPTLENVKAQSAKNDTILVVADNCTDNTAEIARLHGADVIERTDKDNRGKGFALQFALDHLRASPPDFVVFMDADCLFEDGALARIIALASSSDRPAQAIYLMKAPEGASPRLMVAEFAWSFINNVRMRGLQRLFNVTRFTGAGLAVPWDQISDVNLGSSEIVEDLSLTFDLARNGHPPLLAHDAIVESEFPSDEEALTRQSARWSIGSLQYSARKGISTVIEGLASSKPVLVGAALDLMIPPLTIFVASLCVVASIALIAWPLGAGSLPFFLSVWALILTAGSIFVGWLRFGREALPPAAMGGVFQFLISKLAVFGEKGRQSAKQWTPTRNNAGEDERENE
ncbi:glycosyltransferase family 2 protein [Hyphococcus sp. DH-69]|uniref:glycosyltransferase family 2 protein n=1 Tax=Hyphococcus formosus TaxID=3143534 RepID=UPI00398B5EEE